MIFDWWDADAIVMLSDEGIAKEKERRWIHSNDVSICFDQLQIYVEIDRRQQCCCIIVMNFLKVSFSFVLVVRSLCIWCYFLL